jgi:nitroreductase
MPIRERGILVSTAKAIHQLRAVKDFDPAHKMTNKEIEKLLSLALASPSSFNVQNWRFVVVQDKELRQQIRHAAWDQPQITDASILVVLCADLDAWEKEPIRYWRTAPTPAKEFVIPAIEAYYDGLDQMQRDEAMRSCGIAAQTIMLAAKSMGYDACPVEGFDFEEVAEIINLPEAHAISLFVAIGKAAGEPQPPNKEIPMDEVVFRDHF